MRVRTAVAAILFCAVATTAGAAIRGAWTASNEGEGPGFIQLNMVRTHSSWGNTTELSSLSGLSNAQINATSSTPVAFEMRRDAGVIKFDGVFRNGIGAGQFEFTPNRAYVDTLHSLGTDLKSDDGDEESALFRLAMHDVSADFIREMQSLGYRGSIDTFVRFRIHGVTPQYVRDFASLGFKNVSAEDMVRTRIHGATPEYVRAMRDAGFTGLSLEDLVRSRIHGASPEFIKAMRDRGYGNLSMDDYVRFRIHGVTPEFVDALRPLGYTAVAADDLVRMKVHDVTPEYIKEMQGAGYSNLPVDELVRMRIHGVDAEFARKANSH